MKTSIRVLFAALLATTVVACQDKEADEAAAAAEAAANAPLTAPSDPADEAGWQAYVTDVVRRNLGDVTNSPYVYYLPATAESAADQAADAADAAEDDDMAAADDAAADEAPADRAATMAEGSSDYARLLDKAKEDIARGILPGNMLAFASPDSSVAGDLAVATFEGVEAGALKGVRVLFIGEAADGERVRTAVEPSGATYVFVDTN
jgi:hypothetical protein